ncbi:MAG TPA: type II toxin-antitoxin system VapC family toxin [Archaeoglobaceae archaeon]|nr:type II toxin-antitoxin system VapC family toxin [Archaeoglobaceae archaeon]
MVVFDTEAILIFYFGEEGADNVENLLIKIQKGEEKGFMNVINLTEFYYILYRKNPEIADEKVQNLKAYGIEFVPVLDDEIWREAGKIKAEYAIPLADAFAAATAIIKQDELVAGNDRDFENLGIPLLRLR